MIDFLINVLYEKDIIKKRRLLSAIRILSEVKNIVYGIDIETEGFDLYVLIVLRFIQRESPPSREISLLSWARMPFRLSRAFWEA